MKGHWGSKGVQRGPKRGHRGLRVVYRGHQAAHRGSPFGTLVAIGTFWSEKGLYGVHKGNSRHRRAMFARVGVFGWPKGAIGWYGEPYVSKGGHWEP